MADPPQVIIHRDLFDNPRVIAHLTPSDEDILRSTCLLSLSMAKVISVLGREGYYQKVLPPLELPLWRPSQRFNLSYDPTASFLIWRTIDWLPDAVIGGGWNNIFGPVRDQLRHHLCWLYVVTDLILAIRRIRDGLIYDDDFDLSVLDYLYKMKPEVQFLPPVPDIEGNNEGHICTEPEDFVTGLRFTENQPRPINLETHPDFQCTEPPPINVPYLDVEIHGVREYNTIQEALATVGDHPLGASLAKFTSLDELTPGEIYRGPTKNNAKFECFHAVIVTNVLNVNGEWVAECRLSNGVDFGDNGYIRVSLSTMFVLVDENQPDDQHPLYVDLTETYSPNYLLRDFAVPVINPPPLVPLVEEAVVEVEPIASMMDCEETILCGEGKKRKAQGTDKLATPKREMSKQTQQTGPADHKRCQQNIVERERNLQTSKIASSGGVSSSGPLNPFGRFTQQQNAFSFNSPQPAPSGPSAFQNQPSVKPTSFGPEPGFATAPQNNNIFPSTTPKPIPFGPGPEGDGVRFMRSTPSTRGEISAKRSTI